jgi:hypothetical protein
MKKTIWVICSLAILTIALTPVSAQPATDSTFVAMYGTVTLWGSESAYGQIGAFAEVPDKWAEVGIFWIPGIPTILSLPANFTFYVARLNITEKARLDYSGCSFYVSGWWDAYKITIEYDETGNIIGKTIEPIVEKGYGELKVITWESFTVEIPPIEPIRGEVLYYDTWSPPPYEIIRGDVNLDGKVSIQDLSYVARRLGTTPGMGISKDFYVYDFNIDFNFDGQIDIDDLIVVAKDFGFQYGTP